MAKASRRVSIRNVTRGTTLGASVRVAGSMADRMVGLLRTPEAELSGGLYIEHASSIHMVFMPYAIDAAFVASDGRVTKVVEGLRPWRVVWWARGARDCLELPVGAIATSGTRVGDRLEVLPAA